MSIREFNNHCDSDKAIQQCSPGITLKHIQRLGPAITTQTNKYIELIKLG